MDFQLFSFVDGLSMWGEVLKTFGPLLAAVVFFLWRDFRREDRLLTRINVLEDEQRLVILPLVTNCTKVVTENSQVMGRNTKVIERLERALDRTHN